jgi:hypothetical protein
MEDFNGLMDFFPWLEDDCMLQGEIVGPFALVKESNHFLKKGIN